MIDELLVSFLGADSDVSDVADEIAVGEVPRDSDGNPVLEKYIWISQFEEFDHLDLDGESGLTEYRFDIECVSMEIATAKRLARAVKKRLQGHAGDFGSIVVDAIPTTGTIQACYVESKDDDYIPVNTFNDEAMAIIAMDITIFADDAQDDLTGD